MDILFSKNITEDSINGLKDDLRGLPLGQRVWINSLGGHFHHLLGEADNLHKFKFISVGCKVHSSANLLFLFGAKRYVLPEAEFFFHEIRYSDREGNELTIREVEVMRDFMKMGNKTDIFIESTARHFRNAQSELASAIRRRSKMSFETVLHLMRREVVLSAREAVHYGLADEIISGVELKNFFD